MVTAETPRYTAGALLVAAPDWDRIEVAVVTGGGRGIGRAICRRLHKESIKVVVVDLDQPEAAKVAAEISGHGHGYGVDVSVEADVIALIEAVEESIGPIDLFVSNAGVGFGDGAVGAASKGGLTSSDADRWSACWNVNVMSHVYAARALLPRMTQRGGGYFINIASAAGLLSQIGDAAYAATKHAAVAFAESLAITHGDDGIQVSLVCPQAVATRMIGIEDDSDTVDGGFGGNDVDGVLSADEVAECIVTDAKAGRFLILPHPQVATYFQRKASDHDRWISGMQRFRRKLDQGND